MTVLKPPKLIKGDTIGIVAPSLPIFDNDKNFYQQGKILLEELGFKDFSPPFENSCANHGGSGLAAVQQWDAKTKSWSLITDYMGSDRAIIDALIAEDSNKYAAEQNIAERCN